MVQILYRAGSPPPGEFLSSPPLLQTTTITVFDLPDTTWTTYMDDEYYLEKLDSTFHVRLQRLKAPTWKDFLEEFEKFEEELVEEMGEVYMKRLDRQHKRSMRIAIASARYIGRFVRVSTAGD